MVAGLQPLIVNVEQRAIPICSFQPIQAGCGKRSPCPVSFRYWQLQSVNRYMAEVLKARRLTVERTFYARKLAAFRGSTPGGSGVKLGQAQERQISRLYAL